jgi:hypothetical protein
MSSGFISQADRLRRASAAETLPVLKNGAKI